MIEARRQLDHDIWFREQRRRQSSADFCAHFGGLRTLLRRSGCCRRPLGPRRSREALAACNPVYNAFASRHRPLCPRFLRQGNLPARSTRCYAFDAAGLLSERASINTIESSDANLSSLRILATFACSAAV